MSVRQRSSWTQSLAHTVSRYILWLTDAVLPPLLAHRIHKEIHDTKAEHEEKDTEFCKLKKQVP